MHLNSSITSYARPYKQCIQLVLPKLFSGATFAHNHIFETRKTCIILQPSAKNDQVLKNTNFKQCFKPLKINSSFLFFVKIF